MTTHRATDLRPAQITIEEAVVTDYDLGPYAGWLYVVIVKFINRKTNDAFPGIATLARIAGMTEPTVLKYIKVLEEKGLLRVTRSENDVTGERGVNHYQLPRSVTREVVNVVYQGGKTDLPGVVNDVYSNHKDSFSTNVEKGGAQTDETESEKKPRKKVVRTPLFITLARESFKIFDVDSCSKTTVILINKILAWLKENAPNANERTLTEFYKWYDRELKGAARPQDAGKFGKHFDAFKQQALAAKAAQTPELSQHEKIRQLKAQQAREEQNRIREAAQQKGALSETA